jgi:hypothetical protein
VCSSRSASAESQAGTDSDVLIQIAWRKRSVASNDTSSASSSKAPSELVSPVDLIRVDELGRTYVACPANTAPHSELKLTDEEKASLTEAPPPKPRGFMNPGHCGFTPESIVVSEWPSTEHFG